MVKVIKQTNPKARKDYCCMACEWISDDLNNFGLTFSDYREIVKAKRNGYKIKKGEKYISQFNTDCGDTWTFRAIPAIHEICIKYKLYDL